MLFPTRLPIKDHHLTAREAEVLWHCAQGETTPAISTQLFVSRKTVERHKENIKTRFGLCGHHMLHQFAYEIKDELKKWVNLPIA